MKEKPRNPAEISSELNLDELLTKLGKMVRSQLEEKRDFYVHEIVQAVNKSAVERREPQAAVTTSEQWVPIDSLSQLRAIVGGRFENLKKRWLDSGFPLKESKGEKLGKIKRNQEGWTELSSWALKQGFEIRTRPDLENALFELKVRRS